MYTFKDAIYIDVNKETDIIDHINKFKLLNKIDVLEESTELHSIQSSEPLDTPICFSDPRNKMLGFRAILSNEQLGILFT